jgi:hypothetical protein
MAKNKSPKNRAPNKSRSEKSGPKHSQLGEGIAHPLPPLRSDATLVDRRAEFAAISTEPRRDLDAERSFVASKLKLLRTHPVVHPEDRETAISALKSQVATLMPVEEIGPVPGGVGYGMFYNSAFKTSFATGTAVSWEIICPTLPGGNVNTWLYLTATNRSSKGVEAFVAYQGQNEFSFNIFDWARADGDRWRPATPFANLSAYIGAESVHGVQCQVIEVMNTTYQRSPGNWANEVRLLDIAANEWHLVYQYIYAATLQDQTNAGVGSWAPIVETFQDSYSGTNLMGALKTQILSRDGNGNWGQWIQLTLSQSDLRVDNKGFVNAFLDPNYSWAVNS